MLEMGGFLLKKLCHSHKQIPVVNLIIAIIIRIMAITGTDVEIKDPGRSLMKENSFITTRELTPKFIQ